MKKTTPDTPIDFHGKRVLVMGLGLHGGGVGTVKFLVRHGALVTVTDLRTRVVLQPSLTTLASCPTVAYVLGEHREKDFTDTDLILKNPGVRPDSPYLAAARAAGISVTTDLGIFFRICPARIIGVTGTRGKSTTAWLIWKFLRTKKRRVYLGGNIRRSVLEFAESLRRGDTVVLELSSFQLEDLRSERRSPHIAVMTNILRDHLNWHPTMAAYQHAKEVIFAFQKKDDYLYINPNDTALRHMAEKTCAHVEAPAAPKKFLPLIDNRLGEHYRAAVGLAIAVARHERIPFGVIERVLASFRGLPARQEIIASIGGVSFVNDTTATVPDATIAALRRFRPRAREHALVLIAGGQDKKLDFTEFVRVVAEYVDVLILLPGTATDSIRMMLAKKKDHTRLREIHDAKTMTDAIDEAWRGRRAGDWIILSPGATSFGLFTNEFNRGDMFAEAVEKLKKTRRVPFASL
ncbi:MAG: UDP-N-acetylmuramoyl-L-alanine--D-glutamate ligase [bacterium]|nr:UDP-N-acetylmuramoyl-L-alanine--D-glutamate ligase [bacterium]MDZ4299426.1 UDP-N-acetylmuramoyl-L-alanine--D-glutamate ligase [Candidatus Sungbacteria bacterium]